jgi:hypothetical protein
MINPYRSVPSQDKFIEDERDHRAMVGLHLEAEDHACSIAFMAVFIPIIIFVQVALNLANR